MYLAGEKPDTGRDKMTRSRTATPAIGFIFLHGTTDLEITATPAAITWDHSHIKTSHFAYTDGGTKVTVNRGGAGIYMVYLNAGIAKKAGNPVHSEFTIYINGVAQPCCTGHSIIGAGAEHSDVALIVSVTLNYGDYLEVYASVDAGTGNLEEDTARLIIEALPVEGWNNGHGSKEVRHGRER